MNIKIIYLAYSFLFLLSSCCTAMYCEGIEDLDAVYFYNFQESELADLSIYTYTNESYTMIIDSAYVGSITAFSDYLSVNISPSLDKDGFYKIKLKDNSTYTIDNFKSKKEKCNSGFMCRDSYQALDSYKVNGVKQEYYNVRIYK